jgi:hypothetical protein
MAETSLSSLARNKYVRVLTIVLAAQAVLF